MALVDPNAPLINQTGPLVDPNAPLINQTGPLALEMKIIITVKLDLEQWSNPAMRGSLFTVLRGRTLDIGDLWMTIIKCVKSAITNRIAYDIINDILGAGLHDKIADNVTPAYLTGWYSSHEEQRLLEFAKFLREKKLLIGEPTQHSPRERTVYQYSDGPALPIDEQDLLDKWIVSGEDPPYPVPSIVSDVANIIVWRKAVHVIRHIVDNRIKCVSIQSMCCFLGWSTSRAILHDAMRTADKDFAQAYMYLFDVQLMIRHNVTCDEAADLLRRFDLNNRRATARIFRLFLAIAKHYNLEDYAACYIRDLEYLEYPQMTDRIKVWAMFLLVDHGYLQVRDQSSLAGRLFRIVGQLPLEVQLPISALLYPQPSTAHHLGQYVVHPDAMPDVRSVASAITDIITSFRNPR